MQKQKMYAGINIGGFAIGIAACLLIGLYIKNELSYDRDNPAAGRVYRIYGLAKQNGVTHSGTSFPAPMATALLNDFPEVEKVGRVMSSSLFGGANNQVRRADQQNDTYEEGFCFADTSILDILNVHMLYGDRGRALSQPFSIVLNKTMADKYYPGQNPVGQRMVFNDNPSMPIVVGGVMADFAANSHMQYRGFISLKGVSFWDGEQQTWDASNYGIYLRFKNNIDKDVVEKKMTTDILAKYFVPAMVNRGQTDAAEIMKNAKLVLQPLTDIHLKSYTIDEDPIKHGDIRFIWLFAGIAVFILVLACINFLNLSTARSANRAKEVGLRKVIGSGRLSLIKQFLVESLLYSAIACCLAVALAMLVLPLFNKAAGTQLAIPWGQWWLVPCLAGFTMVIGLLAGLYPAFYLSYFKPINVLKGNLARGSKNAGLRSALVVFQFTVSVVLMISTVVVYRQMQHILNSDIGFNKDQIVTIQGTDALRTNTDAFKNELLRQPLVKNVSVSDFLPVQGSKRNGNTFWHQGKEKEEDGIQAQRWVVDENYLPTFGMKLVAGRNFSKEMKSDSDAIIINQAMAEKMGFQHPLGQKIFNGETRTIIGVVENFYFESLRQQVNPLCLVPGNSNSIISVKVNGANMQQALAVITSTWKSFLPHQNIRYSFMDQTYAAMYADVQQTQYIFTGFAVLAVIVACLGLFALAAFMAEQRRKEISIRKVLGASVQSLLGLLTGNFIKLVLVSLVIAIPAAWLLMNQWLQNYAYRINITWDVFALTGVAVLLIALLTICGQAVKATLANPAESLRSE